MNSYLVGSEEPEIGQFVVDNEGRCGVVCMKYPDGRLVVSSVTAYVRFNADGATETRSSGDMSVLREVTVRKVI